MKEININQSADVYSFVEQFRGSIFPADVVLFNVAPRTVVHPELQVELAPFNGVAEVCVPTFEHLHRLMHNMFAIAQLNQYNEFLSVGVSVPEVESVPGENNIAPKKRGRPRRNPEPEIAPDFPADDGETDNVEG